MGYTWGGFSKLQPKAARGDAQKHGQKGGNAERHTMMPKNTGKRRKL